MSALGLGVLFILSFAIGIIWLALSFDGRIGRSKLVSGLPLPLDDMNCAYSKRTQSELRPLMALAGLMLILCAGMSAVVLGRLATLQPAEAAAVFEGFPLLQSLWGYFLGLGPVACVVITVPGTYCVIAGRGRGGR